MNSNLTAALALATARRAVGVRADGDIVGGKTGQDIQSTARAAAVVLSVALQHGTAIETIRRAVKFNGCAVAASIVSAVVVVLPAAAGGAV